MRTLKHFGKVELIVGVGWYIGGLTWLYD
jgi:hypothetical protein